MTPPTTEGGHLHESFLGILDRVLTHGRFVFRFQRCPHTVEDCLQEMIGLAWLWHCRLVQQGKDSRRFASVIATYAARHVHNGDRLCGYESANDVLSGRAKPRHSFRVHPVESGLYLPGASLIRNTLADYRQVSPADRAAFRIDFPAWLCSLRLRDARLASDLALGQTTNWVARKYQLSPARVSQLRQELYHSWWNFHGECPSSS